MAYNNAKAKKAFAQQLSKVHLTIDQIVRKIALEVLTSLILKSPVDTGRFRGNWFVQQAIDPKATEGTDKNGAQQINVGYSEIARFKIGEKLYILNHLPYSIELEYGSSKQAPNGMVRITVAEFQAYVRTIAAGLKK